MQQLIHILLSLHDDISILAIENVYIDEKIRIYESFINLSSNKSKTQPKKKMPLLNSKGRKWHIIQEIIMFLGFQKYSRK